MESILIGILVLVAIIMIALVLLQHGKGADIGATFGSGASSTVFGSQGSASFLVKLTFGLAAVFFGICILLTGITGHRLKKAERIVVPAITKAHDENRLPPQPRADRASEHRVPDVPTQQAS